MTFITALSDRQRDVAEVLGSLDQIDLKQPVEFSAEEKQQQEQQPEPAAMRKFVMVSFVLRKLYR